MEPLFKPSVDEVSRLIGLKENEVSILEDADIGGVMVGLGSTVLRGFATKKVAEMFEGITRAVEANAS